MKIVGKAMHFLNNGRVIFSERRMKKHIKDEQSQSGPHETGRMEAAPQKALSYFKIGDTIRKYRKERDLKLQDLAGLIDISASMLSKIENGRMIPTIPTLFAIINKLGISPELFFSELNEKEDFPGYVFIPQSDYVPYVKEENVAGFDYILFWNILWRVALFRCPCCISALNPDGPLWLRQLMNIFTL
jgi:transcriptional regulator with XRE-family HTH domain